MVLLLAFRKYKMENRARLGHFYQCHLSKEKNTNWGDNI